MWDARFLYVEREDIVLRFNIDEYFSSVFNTYKAHVTLILVNNINPLWTKQ